MSAETQNVNPDVLEVAPGFERQVLEGSVAELANEEDARAILDKAFDYRGDITLTLKDGSKVEGYVFDRRTAASLQESMVRIFPKDSDRKLTISYAQIAAVAFSGRDPAAGKSWEAWVRKYWEKRAAGEKGIALQPEKLD